MLRMAYISGVKHPALMTKAKAFYLSRIMHSKNKSFHGKLSSNSIERPQFCYQFESIACIIHSLIGFNAEWKEQPAIRKEIHRASFRGL